MANETSTRRDMLKKAAVAGAVVWTVPTVAATPAFAAGSLSTNLCIQGQNKPTTVTYAWVYGDNTFSVCTATGPGQPTNDAVKSTGGPSSGWDYAVVSAERLVGNGSVNGTPSVNGGASAIIPNGGQFTLSGTLDPNTRVTLRESDSAGNLLGGVQQVTYHFSCSQPLCFGDKHGPLEVVSYTVTP